MNLAWLANTTSGYMVGDYISTSFSNGKAYPLFLTASAPNGAQLNESLFTMQAGLTIEGGTSAASGTQVVYLRSASPTVYTAF